MDTTKTSPARCIRCGKNRPVCCDDGYDETPDGEKIHVDPVCIDCCCHRPGRELLTVLP